jgi:hypothetical protein
LPIDLLQIPDIFIYLVREDNKKPICFHRLKPYTDVKNPDSFLGFNEKAKWFLLEEDKSIDSLDSDVFPGLFFIYFIYLFVCL